MESSRTSPAANTPGTLVSRAKGARGSDHPQAKEGRQNTLTHALKATPGVLSVDRLRPRRSGADYFADITLGMPRNLTFQRSEQLTMAATEAVQRHLPGADVVIHTVPTASVAESVHDRIRAVARSKER